MIEIKKGISFQLHNYIKKIEDEKSRQIELALKSIFDGDLKLAKQLQKRGRAKFHVYPHENKTEFCVDNIRLFSTTIIFSDNETIVKTESIGKRDFEILNSERDIRFCNKKLLK